MLHHCSLQPPFNRTISPTDRSFRVSAFGRSVGQTRRLPSAEMFVRISNSTMPPRIRCRDPANLHADRNSRVGARSAPQCADPRRQNRRLRPLVSAISKLNASECKRWAFIAHATAPCRLATLVNLLLFFASSKRRDAGLLWIVNKSNTSMLHASKQFRRIARCGVTVARLCRRRLTPNEVVYVQCAR